MSDQDQAAAGGEGHPIVTRVVDAAAVDGAADAVEALFDASLGALVVRGVVPASALGPVVDRLRSDAPGGAGAEAWAFPNAGMTGGEIRVIGAAATPTFTALRGPSLDAYQASAARHAGRVRAVFGDDLDAVGLVERTLSTLAGGRPVFSPGLPAGGTWAPFNLRALDPGEQIYSHHDHHYGLPVYEHFGADVDRTTLLSWFVTLQAPEAGGELVVYGLHGDDPDPPMLPTRFLDTGALDRRFLRERFSFRAGDMVLFDAGRQVHRVTPVEGARARITMGGFVALDAARARLACWS